MGEVFLPAFYEKGETIMLKSNLLTPVLSGVLAVTVAGSGVLYVLDRNDKKGSDGAADAKNTTVMSKMSKKLSSAAAAVQDVVKGEAENGYTCNAVLDFGEVFTEEAGFEIKPVSLKADSKVKGGKSETDLQLAYDSNSLANVYIITDSDTNTVYLKCPELGDAYLSMSPDDLQSLLKKSGVTSQIGNNTNINLPAAVLGSSAVPGNSMNNGLNTLQEAFKDIDFDALSKDIEEYWQTVKDIIPEGTKKDDITGDISGHSYTYEVKSVDITVGTMKDMMTAIANKAKDDTLIKDNLIKSGISEEQYNKLIDSLTSSTSSISEQQAQQKLFTVDVYSYEGEEVGFQLDLSGVGTIKMVSINTEEVFAIDVDASMQSSKIALKGAFEMDDDTINGSADLNVTSANNKAVSANLAIKDLMLAENQLTGSIGLDFTADGKSLSANLSSTGTEEKPNISIDVNYNGKKAVGLNITGEKTGASDVTTPSGTIFPMTEEGLSSFQQSCNVEGFKAHIKEVLGDELYAKLTQNSVTKRLEQEANDNDQELYKF